MKRFVAVLVAVIGVSGCQGFLGVSGAKKVAPSPAPIATRTPDYFPMAIGSTWTYKRYASTGTSEYGGVYEGRSAMTIVSASSSTGNVSALFMDNRYGSDDKESGMAMLTYSLDQDGAYLQEDGSSDKAKIFAIPLSPREETIDQATSSLTSTFSATILRTSGEGELIVGGKSFKGTIRIDRQWTSITRTGFYTPTTEESTKTLSMWLAPDVGVVKKRILSESLTSLSSMRGPTSLDRTSWEISTYSIKIP